MIPQLTIALLALAVLLAMTDWRKGLVLAVMIGILQDPLRKLAPAQPMYYVGLCVVAFGAAWLRAAMAHVRLSPSVIQGWRKDLGAPFALFLVLVLAQALHSFMRYGSFRMTGIGLLVWLAPIPAIVLAYQFAVRRGLAGIHKLLWVYVACAMVSLSGVYLEVAGYEWRTLGEIGEGQIIYDVGLALKAFSGFFRSSEIAAWHAATMACMVFLLFIGKKATVTRVLVALAVIAVVASLGMFTGRRKMLVQITVFLCTYFFFVAWLQKGMARLAVTLLAAGAIGYVVIVGFVAPDLVRESYSKQLRMERGQELKGYAIRGQSVVADLPARVNELGVQPVLWAMNSFGWLGAGLGTGSQGSYEVALQHGIDRGPAEGGLGKITMELGLPGLFVAAWLLVSLGRHLRARLVPLARISEPHARTAYALVAFLVSNIAAFSVATQAFSDPFALLILGWSLGFVLAMPVLALRGDTLRKRRPRPAYVARPHDSVPLSPASDDQPAGLERV